MTGILDQVIGVKGYEVKVNNASMFFKGQRVGVFVKDGSFMGYGTVSDCSPEGNWLTIDDRVVCRGDYLVLEGIEEIYVSQASAS